MQPDRRIEGRDLLRSRFRHADEGFDKVRLDRVVTVKKQEIFTLGRLYSSVTSGARPLAGRGFD